MLIRPFSWSDLGGVMALWNGCVAAGDVLYAPLTEDSFRRKFVDCAGDDPSLLLVAEEDDAVVGFIHGVAPCTFPGAKPGNAYLTVVLVDKAHRGQGIGHGLLAALEGKLRAKGGETLFVSSINPVNLDWRIPGTPGHDHNNMPGVDADCAGAGFFPAAGFAARHREVAMYMNLSDYAFPSELERLMAKLRGEGIVIGAYDPAMDCEFDRMCDRVGSDYWRDVLRTEIAAWQTGQPNRDPRFMPDGVPPLSPRTLLTATTEGHIVAFTGPVDKQRSGRGWFTGICTDPAYEHRGIATVLFNLLMQAFVKEGAAFSTLFTGTENRAQTIYRKAGMRPVREFVLMSKTMSCKEDAN